MRSGASFALKKVLTAGTAFPHNFGFLPQTLGRFANLQNFFVNYHRLEGKEYEVLGSGGTHAALTLI